MIRDSNQKVRAPLELLGRYSQIARLILSLITKRDVLQLRKVDTTIAENVPLAAHRFLFPKPIVTDRGKRINLCDCGARAGRDLNFESPASACRSSPFDEHSTDFHSFRGGCTESIKRISAGRAHKGPTSVWHSRATVEPGTPG